MCWGLTVVVSHRAKVTCCVGGTLRRQEQKESENGFRKGVVVVVAGAWDAAGGCCWHQGVTRASPRAALAGAGSQEQGLNVQDKSLVLALALRKA